MPIGSSVQVQYMSLTKHNKETDVDTKFIKSSSNEQASYFWIDDDLNSAVSTYTLLQQPHW